jgi:surface polysaccharide O-acyltransferase-like enzyme
MIISVATLVFSCYYLLYKRSSSWLLKETAVPLFFLLFGIILLSNNPIQVF